MASFCWCLTWPRTLLLGLLLLAVAGCEDEADGKPHVEFLGGGFIFNYNLSEAYYGFVVKVTRRIPTGTILEAEFENPGGGPALLVQKIAREGGVEYSFRSPAVEGVEAGRDYKVVLRLSEPDSRQVIASYSRTFRSTADQSILPKVPLTVGPAYQATPDSEYVVEEPAKGCVDDAQQNSDCP